MKQLNPSSVTKAVSSLTIRKVFWKRRRNHQRLFTYWRPTPISIRNSQTNKIPQSVGIHHQETRHQEGCGFRMKSDHETHGPRDRNRLPAVSLHHANARQLAQTDDDRHMNRCSHACGEANQDSGMQAPKPVSCHNCKRIGHKAKFCSMYFWWVGQGGQGADDVEILQCRYGSRYIDPNTCDLRSQWPIPSIPNDSTIVHFTKEKPF